MADRFMKSMRLSGVSFFLIMGVMIHTFYSVYHSVSEETINNNIINYEQEVR